MAIDFSSFLPPYQPVQLPSKGKFYGHNPALKDGWVNIREYCAQEESMLAHMNRENVQHVLNNIINNCIESNSIDANELTTEDAFYLLVWLRANSYGPTYEMDVTCPHEDCNYNDIYRINLGQLKVNYLEEEVKEPIVVKLPKSGLTAEIRCMRRGMEMDAADRASELRKIKGLHKGDITDLVKRSFSITKIISPSGDTTTARTDIEDFCTKYMPSADSLVVDNALSTYTHGADVNVKLQCMSCSRDIYTMIPPGPEFFRPARLVVEDEGEPALGDPDSKQVRANGRNVPEEHQPVGENTTAGTPEATVRKGTEGEGESGIDDESPKQG